MSTTITAPKSTATRRASPGVDRIRPAVTAAGVVRGVLLTLAAIVVGFPVYYTFLGALLPPEQLANGSLLPHGLTFDNFRAVVREVPLGRQYAVSLAVTAVQTAAEVVTSALAAYSLVFARWPGRRVVFVFIIATLAVPGDALVIPNYVSVTGLGLTDTVLGIALPYLAAGYTTFLLRQAFLSFPLEVWEAARLEGCSHLRCLFQIVLPATSPAVTTAAMWSALAAWNGYFWPLLITDSPGSRTIQVGLSQLTNSELANPGVLLAGVAMVLVPTLLLVIVGQRALLHGLTRRSAR